MPGLMNIKITIIGAVGERRLLSQLQWLVITLKWFGQLRLMLDVGKPSAKTGDLLEGMEATEPLIEKHCKVEILLGVHMYI